MKNTILEYASAVNQEKLDADLKAAVTTCTGFSGPRKGFLTLHFTDDATPQEMATAQSIALAHDPQTLTQGQTTLNNIRTVAQSAVGVALVDLTAAQQKALLAALLFRAGGVNPDGTVRPLAAWVK